MYTKTGLYPRFLSQSISSHSLTSLNFLAFGDLPYHRCSKTSFLLHSYSITVASNTSKFLTEDLDQNTTSYPFPVVLWYVQEHVMPLISNVTVLRNSTTETSSARDIPRFKKPLLTSVMALVFYLLWSGLHLSV